MRAWLVEAFDAANDFSGTEDAERRLLKALMLFEAFVRKELGTLSSENEERIITEAFGEAAGDYPSNVVAFLAGRRSLPKNVPVPRYRRIFCAHVF